MHEYTAYDVALWAAQTFLALFFLFAGAPKVIGRGMDRWTGFAELPRSLVIFIGVTEVLGAVGLIAPMAAEFLPWLTPLAALGLAIIALMAAGFHLRADERLEALETVLWSAIAAVIAIGRWNLVTTHADVAPWLVVVALGLLLPSAITNVIVLLRRPARA